MIDKEHFKFSGDGKTIYPENLYTALMSAGWFELANKIDKTSNEYTDEEHGTLKYDGKGGLQLLPNKPVERVTFTGYLLPQLEESRIRLAERINHDVKAIMGMNEEAQPLIDDIRNKVYDLLEEVHLTNLTTINP